MAKNWLLTLVVILTTTIGYAQGKIKGNKNITIIETKIDDFHTIRFGEKFEIELVEDEEPSVEIETDENLHDVIEFSVKDSILSFRTNTKIQSKKRLNITINYTNSLHKIEIQDDAEISATSAIANDSLELVINDYAKAYLNIKNKSFKLTNNNKSTFGISSKSKLNIESDAVILELSENSKTEALIETDSLKANLYQSALAKIEGDVVHMVLTAITSSDFSAKNLSIESAEVITEDSSDVTIQVTEELLLETSGSSEIYLYGDPKITLNGFKDTSSIHKKEL